MYRIWQAVSLQLIHCRSASEFARLWPVLLFGVRAEDEQPLDGFLTRNWSASTLLPDRLK